MMWHCCSCSGPLFGRRLAWYVALYYLCLLSLSSHQNPLQHVVNAKADKYGIDPSNLPFLDTTINLDTNSPTRCSPPEACDYYDVMSVPYITEHVLPSFMQDTHTPMHDMKKTRVCTKKKHILLI